LQELNILDKQKLKEELFKCCGSATWVDKMIKIFPVKKESTLLRKAEKIWNTCDEKDWLEAFSHHPKIGDTESLKKKFASTAEWASGEQSGVTTASEKIIEELAEGNQLYEKKFGHIFIVCATGKSAEEMLAILEERLLNTRDEEILIAMSEQNKITRLRLEKLLS
ncbi:MAG: 2-oxo-4-hydroxy-4-carboxy-5-ureidoimidazoline decarboxylase, partial [Chitinophagales bacterium]